MKKLIDLILERKLDVQKLIEFPEFRQAYTYDCGCAAVQAVLAFFGIDEREENLLDSLDVSEDDGTSVKNIEKVLKKKYNIETKQLTLTIDSLKKLLDQDKPVLMLIQAWPNKEKKDEDDWVEEWNEGHYVIAVGYTDKQIIFEDPSSVVRAYIPFEELDKRWHDFDVTPSGKEKKLDHWGMIFSKDDTDYEYDPMNVIKMESKIVKR
jgi:ABC-type bacteriocin/lantibiotic exporter with double-glycine peptidase domain